MNVAATTATRRHENLCSVCFGLFPIDLQRKKRKKSNLNYDARLFDFGKIVFFSIKNQKRQIFCRFRASLNAGKKIVQKKGENVECLQCERTNELAIVCVDLPNVHTVHTQAQAL